MHHLTTAPPHSTEWLQQQLRALTAQARHVTLPDQAITQSLQHITQTARDANLAQFEETGSTRPFAYLKNATRQTDLTLRSMVELVQLAHPTLALRQHISIVATGGYGRKELFPHSDIDLLILHHPVAGQSLSEEQLHQLVQAILYYLWDMGWKVGYAVRTVDETIALAQADHTIATNLLDARYITGHRGMCDYLIEQYEHHIRGQGVINYIDAKLNERNNRHQKRGDSRFLLEPNIKANKGALRDLHTLYWLARYVYGVHAVSGLVKLGVISPREYRTFTRAHQFLCRVRIHLHALSGRAEERLTFELQTAIGEKLGYRTHHQHRPVERFMKRYFQTAKQVGALTRIFCALLEDEYKPPTALERLFTRTRQIDHFVVQGRWLQFDDDVNLAEYPILILRLFHLAQQRQIDIHPRAMQQVSRHLHCIDKHLRRDPQANQLFLDILLSPNDPPLTLRRMNESGVLGKFIPEFGRIIGQMQYDRYHIYTVDEHTIHAIETLHFIEKGKLKDVLPLSSDIIHQINARHVLLLAMLCHDIAKGTGGNHPQKGEKIVRRLASRFGFDAADRDTTAWLVREHMACSDVAFKRDLSDPKTIEDFAQVVQSPERLRLLILITVADIRAVGPNIWNGWKGELLRDLYHRTLDAFGTAPSRYPSLTRSQFQHRLGSALDHWNDTDRQRYMDIGFPAFWQHYTMDEHLEIAQLLQDVWYNDPTHSMRYAVDRFRDVTHLQLCLPSHPTLISHIAGCVATLGASIVSAKLFVLGDGTAIATLDLQDATRHAFNEPERLEKLPSRLLGSLSGDYDLAQLMDRQRQADTNRQPLKATPRVFIDNSLSNTYSVIEVNGTDRLGFLYDVTRILIGQRLNISTAHIATYGEQVVDVFYVKDAFGLKITHPLRQQQIRAAVLSVLG